MGMSFWVIFLPTLATFAIPLTVLLIVILALIVAAIKGEL
jgi:hypothetical protein